MGWDLPRKYRPMGHPIEIAYHTRGGMAFDNIGVFVKEVNIVNENQLMAWMRTRNLDPYDTAII